MKELLKNKLFINAIILLLIGLSVHGLVKPRQVYENVNRLKKELKKDYNPAKAKITQTTKINSLILDEVKYENGWMFTYVFDAKQNMYMGTFFLNERKYEVEDSINIIYLPKNPAINQYVE
jgi:hypothetical protein